MDAPYESARLRLLMSIAYHQLDDEDSSTLELEAATAALQKLGAGGDLARVKRLSGKPATERMSGLTAREMQILRLLATGRTNRAIAEKLGISEKTVARHVANIFTKLNLSSRAAATAYAYEHQLIDRPA
jgi:DNA-binding NarL/FixJ family response regulator